MRKISTDGKRKATAKAVLKKVAKRRDPPHIAGKPRNRLRDASVSANLRRRAGVRA
jgi:hypothetical protein